MFIYLQSIESPRERRTFEQLYHACRQQMYAAAYHILGNPQDAEDAVHQAFLSIAKNISKISNPECPKTRGYVVTIVENQAIDLYRKRYRHPQLPLEEGTAGMTVEYTGENELARCLAKLPAGYRQIILLKYHYGYTVSEIAGILGLSEDNVYKRIQRAKAQLEEHCKEAGIL